MSNKKPSSNNTEEIEKVDVELVRTDNNKSNENFATEGNKVVKQENIQELLQNFKTQQSDNNNSNILSRIKKYISTTSQIIAQRMPIIVQIIDRLIVFVVSFKDNEEDLELKELIYSPIMFGKGIIGIFFIILITWATIAPLDKAAHIMGMVKPASEGQILQHPVGGVVKHIFVKKNDYVKQGQPILELDSVKAKSEYIATWQQYVNALANENRLSAQRDRITEIQFDQILLENSDKPEIQKIIHSQNQIFNADTQVKQNTIKSLEQQLKQTQHRLKIAKTKKLSAEASLLHMEKNYKAILALKNDDYVSRQQLSECEVKLIESKSQVTGSQIEIASLEHAITEAKSKLIVQNTEFINKMSEELRKSQLEAGAMHEKYLEMQDALGRITICSPVEGFIKELIPTTIGGVITNQPIGEVTPYNDLLIIEALVPSKNIDSIEVGLTVKMNFTSFKSRTSPVFPGKIISLSSDALNAQPGAIGPDGKPQGRQYRAIIELDLFEWNRISKKYNLKLQPGLEVDVQIITGERTLFNYALKPIYNHFFKAFTEK